MRKWAPFALLMTASVVLLLFAVTGEIGAARSRLVWKVIQGTSAVQDSAELLDIESRIALDKCAVEIRKLKQRKP